MADDTTQRAAFNFLREHLQSQEPFTRDEFIAVTGWEKPGTLDTYLRKQYKGLIEKVSDTHFRVTDAFWKFVTWRNIKGHFVGYSITHVDGRFRSDTLLTQDEAAALEKKGERYLIDETTAVTRFIFPFKIEPELAIIKYLFQILFIRSIIQLVNGEEQ